MDWRAVRELFPCTRHAAYLNTATYGPGPTPVVEAVERSLAEWSEGRGDWLEWERSGEEARRLFAALLDATPDRVALVPTVSAAAAQVAADLPTPESGRDAVVVGELEFRSNFYPWVALERRGFEVRCIPFRDGRVDAGEVTEAVDGRTALVALSSVQSASGFRLPLAPVVEACRKAGSRLYLDATQSVGALQLDTSGVDYVAVSGYKWLFAPRGTSFLCVAREHVEPMQPLAPGWKTPTDPYADYYGPPYDLAPRASRADFSLAWHSWVGAAAGLRLISELGVAAIEERCLSLASRFRSGLAAIGREPLFDGGESSHILALRVGDPDATRRALADAGVVAAVRHGYLRASFALFNDEGDVDRALAALERIP